MSVTVTDNFTPKTWAQSYPETWGSTTNDWKYGLHDYSLLATVTLALAEQLSRSAAHRIEEDDVSVTDQLTRETIWERSCEEAFSIMETYWDFIQFRVSVSESFTVTDDETGRVVKGVLVTLNIADKVAKSTARPYTEAFSVEDGISKEPRPIHTDGFAITDDEANRFLKGVPVTLNIAESVPKTIEKPFPVTIFVEDEFFRKAKTLRKFAESVDFAELVGKRLSLPLEETFEIVEFFHNLFTENVDETVSVAELLSRSFSAQRLFAETVDIDDYLTKHTEIKKEDLIVVRDTILQASNAILNNIFARHGEITKLEDFEKLVNQAPGFTEFIPFKVGEYDYEEALVKIAVRSKADQGKPTINNLTMHVDIPDTDDRGTANITTTTDVTRVLFHKHYYNPPEVNVVLLGGNTGSGVLTPYITTVTKTYFEVEIRNANLNRVTGSISWFAKGY